MRTQAHRPSPTVFQKYPFQLPFIKVSLHNGYAYPQKVSFQPKVLDILAPLAGPPAAQWLQVSNTELAPERTKERKGICDMPDQSEKEIQQEVQ